MVRLGLNVDHVATLRNARGEGHPDLLELTLEGIAGGAQSITVHLREDRRHIFDADVYLLKERISVPMNLEMAATQEMMQIALKVLPKAVCIVPEKREERTTEGGLDVRAGGAALEAIIRTLVGAGIRVSLFVEGDVDLMPICAQIGAKAVELHTGAYAQAFKSGDFEKADAIFEKITAAAKVAGELGLEVHAGHGLDYDTAAKLCTIEQIVELNIGHFLVGEALKVGLKAAVQNMVQAMSARI